LKADRKLYAEVEEIVKAALDGDAHKH